MMNLVLVLLSLCGVLLVSALDCDDTYPYRSYDGSCNNLDHPKWGQTYSTLRRIRPAAYDDGKNLPRRYASDGSVLPSPREVSNTIHFHLERVNTRHSTMFMQWGQFVDHDITHTEINQGPSCCDEDVDLDDENYKHPLLNTSCFPYMAPRRDSYYSKTAMRCKDFKRSVGYMEDGVRQLKNELTPWVDASHIYGTSEDEADGLRTFKGGKLETHKYTGNDFLPKSEDVRACFIQDSSYEYCFKTGDHRVNDFAGLSVMHTIFLRYHNQLCDELSDANPGWDDETLYQQARRIIGALMQKITFDDFLPELLGRDTADDKNLRANARYSYDSSIDPTLSVVFISAAFRYGHSSIPAFLTIDGEDVPTGELYRRPYQVLDHLDGIVEGLISEVQQEIDPWYVDGVRNQLFEPIGQSGYGQDLAAINIQRGRDHGLPPMLDYFEHCGLEKPTNFSSFVKGFRDYVETYESVNDIDVYSGSLSRDPNRPSQVAPLYECLISEQFNYLKFGDRFWYQRQDDDTTAFTNAQIRDINDMSLAKIICETTGVEEIHEDVFLWETDDRRNELKSCDDIDGLNIARNWAS